MERNIFQQLQDIEQQLLAKRAIQVHIHISLSPGSPGLSESDVKQLMNDVDSVSVQRWEPPIVTIKDIDAAARKLKQNPDPRKGKILVENGVIRISMTDSTGETAVHLEGVTAENMAEAARILSAWLDVPPQKRVWKEWSKPDRPGLWAFTYPTANGTVFYQEVSEEGAKLPARWGEGHWCYICPAPKIEFQGQEPKPEPAEHWPKWYIPAKSAKSDYQKDIAYYRRDDRHKGQTFHTDGTSFPFGEWIDNKEKEVTEQEAKRRCKPERNLVQGVAHFNEAECEFKITGKYHSTVAWAYDALIQIAKDSHKPRLVSLELNKGFSGSIIIAKNTIEVAYRTPGSAQQRSIINVINRENLIQAVDLLLKWADPE